MPFRRRSSDGAERLAKIAFFEGFTPAELARVGSLVEEVEAEEGAVLTEQGKPGQECYVIVEGQASVEIGGEQKAVVGPGTMIGEMALIDNRPPLGHDPGHHADEAAGARHQGLQDDA